jgi:GT2 family glycosyltransferase
LGLIELIMKTGFVDIVIINLNGKHHLERCLPSIEANCPDIHFQFIVVDNGSQDGSTEWLRAEYPECIVIQNSTNTGFAIACNQGIQASNGEYILMLNNDTEFLNNALKPMVRCLEEDTSVGLVGPLLILTTGDIQQSILCFPSLWKIAIQNIGLNKVFGRDQGIYYPFGTFRPTDYVASQEAEWLSGACLMFRRSLFNLIGPLDEEMPFGIEDMDYARRALDSGFTSKFLPEAKVMHFKGGSYKSGGSTAKSVSVRQLQEQGFLVYLRKHHSRLYYWTACRFIQLGHFIKRLIGYNPTHN